MNRRTETIKKGRFTVTKQEHRGDTKLYILLDDTLPEQPGKHLPPNATLTPHEQRKYHPNPIIFAALDCYIKPCVTEQELFDKWFAQTEDADQRAFLRQQWNHNFKRMPEKRERGIRLGMVPA